MFFGENKMNKFTTNQFAEDTTAAEIYEMREEHRRAESAQLMLMTCLTGLRWDAEPYEDSPYDGTYSEE